MKFANQFKIFKDENENTGNHYIYVNEFWELLRKRKLNLRKNNFIRCLKSFPGGIKRIHDKEAILVGNVIRYCFTFGDSSDTCSIIAKTIENELLYGSSDKTPTYIQSSLDLYHLIAHSSIFDSKSDIDKLNIDSVPTLIDEHESVFSKSDWQKVRLFELHFFKTLPSQHYELDYETILRLKWTKYESLISFKNCSKILSSVSSQVIKDKVERYRIAQREEEVHIFCKATHAPTVIDFDLVTVLGNHVPETIENILSFDTYNSPKSNAIQCLVILKRDEHVPEIEIICEEAFYEIKRKHNVYLEKIHFTYNTFLKQLRKDEEEFSLPRFHIRDAIETEQIQDIFSTWIAGPHLLDDTIFCEENEVCGACFSDSILTPLTPSNFNVLQEWYIETPLETQLIFEIFINRDSLSKCKTPNVFFQQKLRRLYNAYDLLLNIYNKNFIGILQSVNTNELLIEYKSIKSVFDITSNSGATTGLRKAENQLKRDANSDLCYYNTYLKTHSLNYETVDGEQKHVTSLRKCHIILMLDNLVRLKYVADPNPGEHRSKQVCTLPITLQGLPIDHTITEQWHHPDCDGSFNCFCKTPKELTRSDVDSVLLTKSTDEQQASNQFFRLMAFGNVGLWQKLPDEILAYLEDLQQKNEMPTLYTDENDGEVVTNQGEMGTEKKSGAEKISDDQSETEEDFDLRDLMNSITEQTFPEFEPNVSFSAENEEDLEELEASFDMMSILEDTESDKSDLSPVELLSLFGFEKFIVPPLLCRHPPPAIGRDDDVLKIKEILDEILMKMGYESNPLACVNRILCGPDNKIGKCLIALIESDKKYLSFLPEFPLLHLRKSQITILFSAFKEAGLIHILRFMRDDDQDDWAKLISISHIDVATKHVKRIAISLHIAFLVTFAQTLDTVDLECFLQDMETQKPTNTANAWEEKFITFLEHGSSTNATFALHVDMMKHCDHVVAISLAERLGGEAGYKLLLAAVKGSLFFSYVNNASSYGPYCTKLLFYHYSSGFFHQRLKMALYSTPFKNSTRNFASDTKREMDHIDVLKGFRSGSTVESVTCRMSLIDSLNATQHRPTLADESTISEKIDHLGWEISGVDENHIFPTVNLILRRNGLSLEQNDIPFNVYSKVPVVLPISILDKNSTDVGRYLLMKYITKERMFGMNITEQPNANDVQGPKELVNRAKRSKGITIKRTMKSKIQTVKTERQIKEDVRQKQLAKEVKKIDSLTSENNACQALLKADSSKPKIMKSIGMQRAIKGMVLNALRVNLQDHSFEDFIKFNQTVVPHEESISATICMFEFAGMKFKAGNAKSGKEYLLNIQKVLNTTLKNHPHVSKIIICEEKYSFTPDDMKAHTRDQRQLGSTSLNISHLKLSSRSLNEHSFDKDVLTKTHEGKQEISKYLSQNMNKLELIKDVSVIVDSESHLTTKCTCPGECKKQCKAFSTPIQFEFKQQQHGRTTIEQTLLHNVKQRKGEAEMAVCDWLIEVENGLKTGQTILAFITSGDIDAVCLYLYAVNKFWKKNDQGKYNNTVIVVLQKQAGKFDLYNITALIEVFEMAYKDEFIGIKLAFCLSLGGNDFIPKFHQISHDTVLRAFVENQNYRQHLFVNDGERFYLNKALYVEFVKSMYIPKRHQGTVLTYNTVRALSIGKVEDESRKDGYKTNDPKRWLPPQSAVERLSDLVQIVLEYIQTIGQHDAVLPDFSACRCLRKNESGEIKYDFGPECHFKSLKDLPSVKTYPTKRNLDDTPQHGARRKFLASTPKHRGK